MEKKWWQKKDKKENNSIDDGILLNEGISTVKMAVEEDRKGNYMNAIQSYQKAILLFERLVEQTEDNNLKSITRMKIEEYLKRTNLLLNLIPKNNSSSSSSSSDPSANHKSEENITLSSQHSSIQPNQHNYNSISKALEGLTFEHPQHLQEPNHHLQRESKKPIMQQQNSMKIENSKNINSENKNSNHNNFKQQIPSNNHSQDHQSKTNTTTNKNIQQNNHLQNNNFANEFHKVNKTHHPQPPQNNSLEQKKSVQKEIEISPKYSQTEKKKKFRNQNLQDSENFDQVEDDDEQEGEEEEEIDYSQMSPKEVEELLKIEQQRANNLTQQAFKLHKRFNDRIEEFNNDPNN